jgi:hypothetical protein
MLVYGRKKWNWKHLSLERMRMETLRLWEYDF